MSDHSFILRNGRIIDPTTGRDEIGDLAVVDGRVARSDTAKPGSGACPEWDLAGLVVCPGLIDMHVHLREPGGQDREGIASGTRAAARGGFTTVLAMPNTDPPLDSPEALADLQSRCRADACVRVLACPALTMGQEGRKLTDFAALRKAGAVALSEDGLCLCDNQLMRQAMLLAKHCGLVILDHCEDAALAGNGVLHDGTVARRLGLPGKPRSSEDAVVARNIVLAAETGCPVHLQHLSSQFSVALTGWARSRGLPVSAEATPHHLLLTEQAVLEHGANAKMNPPLRAEQDREALCRAVMQGDVEAIASDHAPHTRADKQKCLADAANGIVGLESAVALCLTELHHRRGMPLPSVLARFTAGPRRILNLPGGTLTPGAVADMVVIDPGEQHTITLENMQSRARNTPFAGFECRGQVKATAVAGKWVYREL